MKTFLSSQSIARRLALGVAVAAGLVLGLTVWFNYRTARDELERLTNAKAVAEIRAAARGLDDFIARIGMLPRSTGSRQQAYGREPDPGMVPLMAQLLAQMPLDEVYGLAMAFEDKDWRDEDSMPWVDRNSWPNPTRVGYDYHDPEQEWYSATKSNRTFCVTEPYFDEGGSDITMVTLAVPMLDADSNFFGVATADLALDRIRELVRETQLGWAAENARGGTDEFAYLVSRAGRILAHPDEDLMLRMGFPGAEVTSQPGGSFIAAQAEGFTEIDGQGERRRVYWATSPLTGWKIVLNISTDAILVPVRQLTLRSALIGLAGLAILVLIVSVIARRLGQPLLSLAGTATAIEQGDFDEEMLGELPQRRDELGGLSRSIQRMAREIRTREQNLAELNQNLERTVDQRTEELTTRASELERLTGESQERVVVESALSALNTNLRGNLSVEEVAKQGLGAAIEFLEAPMGAIFVVSPDGVLRREAAHAYPKDPDLPVSVAMGSGTIGQAAKSRRAIVINPKAEALPVQFGFGALPPTTVAAYPLLANNEPMGVLELCLFHALTETQSRWLEQATETIANALRFAQESEERQRAEERTRLILESSAEGIFGTDTEGRITFINPAACRMLGFTLAELLGQSCHLAFHHHRPDGSDFPEEECPMYGAYRHGKASRIDDECLWHKDGTSLPVEYGATPIVKEGDVVGSVVSFTDITVRKQQESELLTQHSALESAANAIVITDCKGHIQWVNPAFTRLTGYTREEAIGQNPRVLKSGVHDAEFFKDLWQTVLSGSVWQGTLTNKRKDGGHYQEEMTITPVRSKKGDITHFVAVKQDITERLRADQRLREMEKFFRSVLELAPDGLMVVDAEGAIQLANAQCEKLFGYPREELLGQPVELLVPMDVRAGHPALRETFHRSPAARELGSDHGLRGQRKDGSVFPVEVGLSPLPSQENEGAQIAVSIRDVTEHKRMEDELRQAMAKAEEATVMKSMFLANMSHEIRTPMNAIIGLSHLALKTHLTAKQRDYVSKVHNAGTSLLAVINDILDFSKIEAGKLEMETTNFHLDEVISAVTTLTAQKAHEKGLEYLAHVGTEIPDTLLGDPLRLGQVLTNLVNNAVKFTEQGEIRLDIEQVERTGEKVQLQFSVRDTGMGMTKEQAARLFQPFTQADMSTTRKHGGTGLGLTICRKLIELMGGRIWLESEPSMGSTFCFTVWLGIGAATKTGRRVPAKVEQLRVLVVDDNPAAREILMEPLSTLAAHVETVASGREAIEAIQTHDAGEPYDIVFLDWRMPGMDGLQASRHIKSDETLAHPPHIVMVTAFGREEVREEAERLDLDGFLVKPVTKSMIVDTLVNVFAHDDDEAGGEAKESNETRLPGARILLTEDNEINQQIAVELLEGVGATVTLANHGREAVELLSNGPQPPPFDVVLMDLQMPEMDGYQATTKLRSEDRFASLPIIAMTAHATVEERQRCLAAGMDDHIAKPIDPAALFDTVLRHWRRGEGEPTAQPSSSGDDTPKDAAGQTSTPDVDALPEIEGLDTKAGLQRVAGNAKLYRKLLRQFAEQQADAADRIGEAHKSGDKATAERLAHTVKGVAGSLGADEVLAVAGQLEKAIREQDEPTLIDPLRARLAAILEPLVAGLRSDGEETPAAESPPPQVDEDQLRAAVRGMRRCLEDYDAAAGDCLENNRDVFRALFPPDEFATFEQQIGSFAFDEALALLQTRDPA